MNNDNLVSYILSAKNRLIILRLLRNQGLTTSEIAEITKIDYRHVWEKLQELKNKELVTHNDVYRNKIYRLTSFGYSILNEVEQRD